MRTSQISCGRTRCRRRPQPAAGASAIRLTPPSAVTSQIVRRPQHHNRIATSAALPEGLDDKAYARDELTDYEELLRQKKAAKRDALEAAIRRRKLKAAAAQQQQQQPQSPAADTAAAAPSSADSGISTAAQQPAMPVVPSGARFASRPRAIPASLRQQQQRQTDSPVAPAAAAAAAAAQKSADAGVIMETSTEGLPSDDVLKAMLEELLEGEPLEEAEEEGEEEESEPRLQQQQERQRPAAALPRRRTPAQIRAATAARRAAQRQLLQQQQLQRGVAAGSSKVDELVPVPSYNDRRLAQLAARDPNAAALQQMLAAAAADDDGNEDESAEAESASDTTGDEDLDWEALGQYEQLEQYLGDLQKQQASTARPGRPTAATTSAFPATASTISSITTSSSSSSASKPSASPKKLKRVPAGTAAKQFEKDLDELEQFVSLFEALENAKASGGSSNNSKLQRPQQSAVASADPGEALVAVLLGQDWEAELLDELAAVVDEDEADDQPAATGSSGQQQQLSGLDQPSMAAAATAQEDTEPWADDVTGLLLGLVTISHERYLKSPIPLPDVRQIPEDERCSAFWSAPWALVVTDDSGQYNMEYVNESAGQMLGGGYLDLFGQPAFEMVANSLEAQSDWAYAVQRVEESVVNCARIPRLELRDLSGQPVIARDVTMWRVDSLEDTPIGMAVLIQSWERK